MANGAAGIDPSSLPGDDDAAPGSSPGAPPGPGAGGGGGPGAGGGPILAALARNRRGPQVSAPGAGDTASSMTMIMNAINMLQQAMTGLPPGSPLHRDVVKGISSLSRHVGQAGQPTAGVQKTQLQDMLRNTMRNALLQNIMQQQSGGKAPDKTGPGGPSPIPGAMATPPMPSTPLPGA